MSIAEQLREEGRREGRREGLSMAEEMRQQGVLVGRIQICQGLLHMPMSSAEELGRKALNDLQTMNSRSASANASHRELDRSLPGPRSCGGETECSAIEGQSNNSYRVVAVGRAIARRGAQVRVQYGLTLSWL